ncbi:hypothetical protein [Butyrivibrio sp. WCD2001]|uniref:hypothetical protein n=1 Tax=Butyrivibrio sp. WCD2001 TaxID=1280681 RepID=UPI00040B33B7|nr:hypothetical protein [Butyrivibrio sp. WCD2001]
MKKRIIILFSVVIIIFIGVFAKWSIEEKNKATYKSRHETFASQYFYEIDRDTGELVISKPAVIEVIKNWDKYGCRYIYSFADPEVGSNEEMMRCLHSEDNPDEWGLSVVDAFYIMLAEDEFKRSAELIELDYDSKISMIELKRSYTIKDINDAMEVFVLGAENASVNNQYKSIMDVPYDLQNACIFAMDKSTFTAKEMIICWSMAITANS